MRHLIIITFALLFSGSLFAQKGTSSPYSFYGMGMTNFKGTAENKAMGGLSIMQDSIHLNILNPASLGELDYVNFTVGVGHKYSNLKTNEASQKASTSNFEYLALGIPIGKVGLSFGLLPSSSVGYELSSSNQDHIMEYEGRGGVNKTFLSLGYNPVKELSLGIESAYNFGSITNQGISRVQGVQYASLERNEFDVNGFEFKFAGTYKKHLNNKSYFLANISYSPKYSLTSKNSKSLLSIDYHEEGGHIVRDERDLGQIKGDVDMPEQMSFGLGYGKEKHWFVGAEYQNRGAEEFNSHSLALNNVDFVSSTSYRLGGYYIPNHRSFTKVLQRSVYRFGMRYDELGIKVNQEDINEFGMSFGIGVPMKRYFSNLNFSLEVGKRGTKKSGLIQENFVNMSLTFSLNDKWFQKRYIY